MIKSKYINDILDLLLDGDDEDISTKRQLEYLSEEKFDYTGSGVFVKFSHTENAKDFKTEKLDLVLNGVTIITSEYAIECDAILFLTGRNNRLSRNLVLQWRRLSSKRFG